MITSALPLLLALSIAVDEEAIDPPVLLSCGTVETGVGAAIGAGAGIVICGGAGSAVGALTLATPNPTLGQFFYYAGWSAVLGCAGGAQLGALIGAMVPPPDVEPATHRAPDPPVAKMAY